MFEILESIEEWGWVVWIGSNHTYTAIAMLHYFTIFWVVGTIALIDLRVLGLVGMRQTATEWQKQLAPWLWTAMTLCLVTGFVEFAPGGGEYYLNFVFRWKLWATLAGIILAVIVYRGVPKWDRLPAMPVSAKALAALCLLVWVGTILLGVEVANYVNF